MLFRSGAGTNGTVLVAVIDIPAAGIVATNGTPLRFRGNMPPGNTGAMTFKLPLNPLHGEAQIEHLRDLDFAEESRRVKTFWSERARTGLAVEFPLRFREKNFSL